MSLYSVSWTRSNDLLLILVQNNFECQFQDYINADLLRPVSRICFCWRAAHHWTFSLVMLRYLSGKPGEEGKEEDVNTITDISFLPIPLSLTKSESTVPCKRRLCRTPVLSLKKPSTLSLSERKLKEDSAHRVRVLFDSLWSSIVCSHFASVLHFCLPHLALHLHLDKSIKPFD